MRNLAGGEKIEGLYIDLGMNWQETLQGEQAVIAALRQMEQTANRTAQAMMGVLKEIAANTYEGAFATVELAEAQQKQSKATGEVSESTKKARVDIEGMTRGLTALTLVTAGVEAALIKLSKEAIDAFNQQTAAYQGLETVARRTGAGVEESRQAVQRLFAEFKGMASELQLAAAIKNLEAVGYTAAEAERLLRGIGDAAAYNRQQMFTFGEAIVRTTEGIKNGNSITSDAAGITKNLSVILQEAGKSVDDLQRIQSDASVRMALYNGLLKETGLFAGDAARYADTLAGSQAQLAAETQRSKAALGEGLAPALQALLGIVVPAVQNFGEWARQNPETARSIVIVTGAVVGLIGVLSALSVIVATLSAAFGPWGALAAVISVATGVMVGNVAAAAANAAAMEQNREQAARLAEQYHALRRAMETGTEEEKKQAQDELRRVVRQLADLMPELVDGYDAENDMLKLNTQRLDENTRAVKANREAREQATQTQAALNLSELVSQRLTAESALAGLERAFQGDDRRARREAVRRLAPEFLRQYDETMNAPALTPEEAAANLRSQEALLSQILDSYRSKVRELTIEANRAGMALRELTENEPGGGVGWAGLWQSPEDEGKGDDDAGDGDDQLSKEVRKRLKEIDRLRQEGRISLAEEQRMLQEALDTLASTAEDAAELQHRIIMVGNQMRQESVADALAWVDSIRKAGGPQALEDEMAAIERVMQKWGPQLTKQQRRQLEERIREIHEAIPVRDLKAGLARLDREIAQAVREGLPESTQAMMEIAGLERLLEIPGLSDEDRQKLEDRIADLFAGLGRAQFEETMKGIEYISRRRQREADDQVARLEAEAQAEETTAARKIQIADEVHRLRRAQYEDEIRMLQAVVEATEAGTEQRRQAEEALAAAQARLRDADLDHHRAVERAKAEATRAAEQAALELVRRTEEAIRKERERTYREERQRIQDRFAMHREAIQGQIDGIDEQLRALQRMWNAEDRQRQRQRLLAEADAIRANIEATRRLGGFWKVDPATGRLVETFDEERVRELEDQLAQNQQRLAELDLEEARELQRQALEDQRRYLQERLERLQQALQEELDLLEQFWNGEDGMLSKEAIHQAALTQLQEEAQGRRLGSMQAHLFGPGGVIPMLSDAAAQAEALWARIQAASQAAGAAAGAETAPGAGGGSGGGAGGSQQVETTSAGALLAAATRAAVTLAQAPVVNVGISPQVPMRVDAHFPNVTSAEEVIDALTTIGGQAAGMLAAKVRI